MANPVAPKLTTSNSEDIGLAHNVEITKILLYNHMGEVINIREIFLEMNLQNSIFQPGIYGSILIQDSHSLSTRFPIIGEEKIEIEWYTPGNKPKFFRGMVYTISDLIPDDKGSKSSYILRFCSEELFQNASAWVAKSYTNTLTANEIIEDILKTYLNTEKVLHVDPCREIQKTLIIPYLRPFDAIDFMRQRVKPMDDATSDYYEFFERFDGVHFRNLSSIVQNKLNQDGVINDYIYISDKFSNQNEEGTNMKRIISFKINNRFDTIDKINEGMFNNENFEYSFDDKQVYSETKSYKDFKPILGAARMNTDDFIDKYDQNISKGMNGSITTFKERRVDQNFNFGKPGGNYLINRMAMNQISITITVPGDSTVDVGDLCQVMIPEFDADAQDTESDKQLTGLYMIGSVRNVFLVPDKHTLQLDLYKDGYGETISGMSQRLKENLLK